MQRILVATDGSEQGNKAVETAGQMAGAMSIPLVICHVLMHHRPPEELSRMAHVENMVPEVSRRTLADLDNVPGSMMALIESVDSRADAERVMSVIGEQIVDNAQKSAKEAGAKEVTTRTEVGDYAECIAEVARDEGADLIVIGSRGLGSVTELLLGSVSRKVVHLAKDAVLIVK